MLTKKTKTRRDFLAQTFNTGVWLTVVSSGLIGPLVKVMAEVPEKLPLGQSIYDFAGEVKVDNTIITSSNMQKTIVRADSSIETGNNSWIIFVIGKDAHSLGENAKLTLAGSNLLIKTMRLFTGAVLSVFGQRQSNEPPLQLHTSTATVGIRGTGIYIESEPQQQRSYVCTCYGEVNISALVDPNINETIKTSHHDNPRYIYADNRHGELIQAAPFKNHTDQELQLIETLVGRTTPFSSVKEPYARPRKDY